jgi:hypothetical protein
MARTLEQIEDELLSLSEESRVRLIERLLFSLQRQATPDEEDIARAWVEEAERRDHEMSGGSEEGLPAEKVFSKLRSSLRLRFPLEGDHRFQSKATTDSDGRRPPVPA